MISLYKRTIEDNRADVAAVKKARINPRLDPNERSLDRTYVFRTKEDKAKAIEMREQLLLKSENVLADILARKTYPIALLPIAQLAPGEIGSFQFTRARVFQVIDASTMLVEITWDDTDYTFWVSGRSTEGIVDGQKAVPGGLFIVLGTKKYTTALGTARTVWEVQPFKPPDPIAAKP